MEVQVLQSSTRSQGRCLILGGVSTSPFARVLPKYILCSKTKEISVMLFVYLSLMISLVPATDADRLPLTYVTSSDRWMAIGKSIRDGLLAEHITPPSTWMVDSLPCNCSDFTCNSLWEGIECDSMEGLVKISTLKLQWNANGPLPASWATSFPNLHSLWLSDSSFTGTLPQVGIS